MDIGEKLRPAERPMGKEPLDVRREAQRMIARHERQIKALRETAGTAEAFREAAMKATEEFKVQLKEFLSKHGAENLYDELVGFVSGKVAEIVSGKREAGSIT